jgi:hypothetical protein
MLIVAALAIRESRGADRQRAVWTLVPLGLILAYGQFYSFAQDVFPSYAITQYALGAAANLTSYVLPIVLIYAALSRRLLDIGFVLNRAAVFAIVSTIAIGALVAIEWAVSTWLNGLTHSSSVIVGLAVALGLGFSMRYIHGSVDRFVDRVFFHKRHEDETALRHFAHESAYITDRTVLLQRTIEEVRAHTEAMHVTVFEAAESGQYESWAGDAPVGHVSENDPVIVALRAWHKPVDLHAVRGSAVHGEFAFPMVSRGRLAGVLVCGAKPDGESYAPDESEALLALAHGVGAALDTLALKNDETRRSVADELAELRGLIETIVQGRGQSIATRRG